MRTWLAPRWAAAWFVLITLAMTWPLVTGLASDMPWDFGDSLLNCWILAWNMDHMLDAVLGSPAALAGLWHGTIFHPEPYALAYSELLIAQSLQGLPIYAVTGNIILVYNVLFLSTFALSAFGAYLFVRQLTGDNRVAFIAGLLYGFLPYRVDQATHLHILSSQWMPFALYGLRRYFDTGRRRALAGSGAAIVAQNLSCGYYLIYFAFLLPPYACWELVSRRRLRDWRAWTSLLAAGAAVAACTLPFLTPYLRLRALTGEGRGLHETAGFSADLLAYATADENLRMWGGMLQTWPRPEGDLFPGALLTVLAAVGAAAAIGRGWRGAPPRVATDLRAARGRWRRPVMLVALAVAMIAAALVLVSVAGLPTRVILGPFEFRYRGVLRPFMIGVTAVGVALALSSRGRAFAASVARSYEVWFVGCALALAYLSLGPSPTWAGTPLRDMGLYRWIYEHVPGVDGLRVPARLGMLVMLCLTAAAGSGAAVLLRRARRPAVLAAVFGVVALAEGVAAPIPMNQMDVYAEFAPPPDRIAPATRPPAVYAYLASLPRGTVVAEFPLGEEGWDIRAVYHASIHRQPLVNGYSGGFPARYVTLSGLLRDPYARPDGAWAALAATGATHAVVHARAYERSVLRSPEAWLVQRGARLAARFPGVSVYALPPTR